jgi:diacylglycerol kinase (ATP)
MHGAVTFLRERLRAVHHALRGLKEMVATQPHARIHVLATAVVLVWGWLIRLTNGEWTAVTLCIGMVWATEALNTAIESLADEVSKDHRERIRIAKDAAAGGVLIASLASLIVWGLILWKRF